MLKLAFCDDDSSDLKELQTLLDRYRAQKKLKIEGTFFHSPLDLVNTITKGERFDALFLDVLMPGENGISIAAELRQYDSNIKIIFLTYSPDFALESYWVDAYFYQLKPIAEDAFFRLMDSVCNDCQKEQQHSLIIRSKNGITRIDLSQLEYCEIMGRTLLFHLANGTTLDHTGSLEQPAQQLTSYDNFLRPHRSYLVNMDHIETLSYRAITMVSQEKIPIPHGKFSELKAKYLNYTFQQNQILLS